MALYIKLTLAFGLCLFVNVLQAKFVSGNGKLFQSDEGVTETIIRLISEDPVSFRSSVAKYAALENVEMTKLDPYIPMPSQSNCRQCAVSMSGAFSSELQEKCKILCQHFLKNQQNFRISKFYFP